MPRAKSAVYLTQKEIVLRKKIFLNSCCWSKPRTNQGFTDYLVLHIP